MAAIESNLMLTSDTASALAALGWRARVAAVHSGGIADVAAERTWSRGELSARVRLIVRCDAREERLVLASLDAPPIADRLPCYAFGDDDPAQRRALLDALGPAVVERLHKAAYPREIAAMERACIDALPARARASAIRDALLDDAFASIDAVRRDLFEHDLDVVLDDLDLDRDAAGASGVKANTSRPGGIFLHQVEKRLLGQRVCAPTVDSKKGSLGLPLSPFGTRQFDG